MNTRLVGYGMALLSSLSYSAWLISSADVAKPGHVVQALMSVMMVALAASAALSAPGLRSIRPRPFLLSMVGGFAFAAGNVALYVLIPEAGLGIAGAFSSMNLLFFSMLLLPRSRPGRPWAYLGGSVLAVLGIGIMYAAEGPRMLDAQSVAIGLLTAILYALGTYVLYRISSSGGLPASTVGVFAGEVLFLAVPFSAGPALTLSAPAAIAGISLAVALLLEAKGLRILSAFGGGREALVNVLTNLELLPIAAFYLISRAGGFQIYAASIPLVVAGLILISEGVSKPAAPRRIPRSRASGASLPSRDRPRPGVDPGGPPNAPGPGRRTRRRAVSVV